MKISQYFMDKVLRLADENKEVIDEVVDSVFHSVTTFVRDGVVGKKTLQQYAEELVPIIDAGIEQTHTEYGWKYVGGTLRFTPSKQSQIQATISYELFFIDASNEWRKIFANSDVYLDTFTNESAQEIKDAGEVAFEITGL